MSMQKREAQELIDKLLSEIEEEDIGIGLFSTFCQDDNDLDFFTKQDRDRVIMILQKLTEDSKHHKTIIEKLINSLGEKLHEKRVS